MQTDIANTATYVCRSGLEPASAECAEVAVTSERLRLDGNIARRRSSAETVQWDRDLPGFGLRSRASGHKTWIVKFRHRGRQRYITLGAVGTLAAPAARAKARELLASVALDGLPVRPDKEAGESLTFAAYLPEFWRDYAAHWKPSTLASNHAYGCRELVPVFGDLLLRDISRAHVARWRDDLAGRGGVFNRALPVLAAALGYAERLGYRSKGTNPCKGVSRYKRQLPERFLSSAEYRRLAVALAAAESDHPIGVAAIRLLLLTGARRGEVTSLRWEHVHVDRLALPDSKTGPKTIWLSEPARELLASLPTQAVEGWVFPARGGHKPVGLDPLWVRMRHAAALPDVRLHDLRHSFASVAIADRLPLHVVGGLLGHALPETTARYAHLADEVIAEAAGRVCDGLALALGMEA